MRGASSLPTRPDTQPQNNVTLADFLISRARWLITLFTACFRCGQIGFLKVSPNVFQIEKKYYAFIRQDLYSTSCVCCTKIGLCSSVI